MKDKLTKFLIAVFFCLFVVGAIRGDYFSVISVLQQNVNYDNSRSVKKMQEDFDAFLNQLFVDGVSQDTLTLNYTLKNKKIYGLDNLEVSFGNANEDDQHSMYSVYENIKATLRSFNYDKLTKTQQFMYDLEEYMVDLNLESSEYQGYDEFLSETSGVQAQLPVLLVEYNFYTVKDVENYIKLLNLVPDYFNDIMEYEKFKVRKGLFMSDASVELIIKQCTAFIKNTDNNYLITTFENRLTDLKDLDAETKNKFIAQNKSAVINKVIPAYRNLIDGLNALKGTGKNNGGLCGFENGKKYYEYLAKVKTGSERSINEMELLTDKRLKEAQKKISEIIAKDSKVYDNAINVKYKYTEPKEVIEHLKKAMKDDFPTLPDDINYQVKYVDSSLEESLSPAFYLTPAIDNYNNNVVYLNGNKKYDLSKAFTTIAHESYPGHLYQNCYFYSKSPLPFRSIVNIGGYVEGWGTYAELYSYKYAGLDEKTAEILRENTVATLCIYAKADIGINYNGWNLTKLAKYLKTYGFNVEQSKTVYNSIVSEPANYLKYTIGYLEIEQMYQKAERKLGKKFTPKKFHEYILTMGEAPFKLLNKELDKWIKEQSIK
ncbi:DUF885 domain-containing protein [Eubacterium sp. MSJ-13]|uniref:DUF885 domain-containing protein n=1 Tax=Eubacterium sp. MSJ-13 TaxID=2841513 RepID=UPI001C122195|nr:DUF885 domain-containing protein [Eubacterium sp. MSJ-13]MBU5478315.1 DUF885 domain-containing protein [Eubacterium sp. MSJ-13]